ncbi:ABC transporter substrate-binding protein [Cryobacterium sp. CG_9.6]|uniref:ABC transporter substrate-binding protein n=1 Tax=Cryobacterium sp. CG_9.6 TaxID=2760710 RepID=UPI002474F92C|nr:ABC transporter substrate-binding protein [Cryobacterium sp. CG_9.6]MDH6236328.1 iron(III) transport system substrate-binding protein [Cryobacterium sp. CG_9.6]
MRQRTLVGLAIVTAAGFALVGCSPAADTTTSAPEASSMAAEAATITLYTSEPQEKIDQIIAAFNEEQPNITVEVFRAGTGDLTARIEAERTGAEIQADILLAADSATFEQYKADELLLNYTPTDIESVNPDVIDSDGFYVGTRIIPTVIAYNTTAVDAPPTSWQDLTDSEYSGKITMPNPDVSGAAAYNAAVWYTDDALGESWLTDLAANTPVIAESNGPVAQAVAAGTQPIGVVVDYLVRDLRDAGSPIDLIYPSDGVPYVSQPVGIFANTDEAEASGLFVDFLISEAGQTIAVEQSYLPIRNDVGTPEGAPAMDDINIVTPDLDTIAQNKATAVALFSSLFG